MSGWHPGDRPAHLRPVAILGNEPPPRPAASSSPSRPPGIAARCEQCSGLLARVGESPLRGAPGERLVDCGSCGHRNVFYSAAWLSSDEGGTQ